MDTPDGRGTVTEVNLLRQSVKVRMEDNPETCNCYSNCDVCVLRSGKAKKNDPPIPADLAPISGSGKRSPKPQQEERSFLEPVRFRYRTDSVVDEQPEDAKAEPEQQIEQPGEKNRRPRRPRNAGKGQQPAPEQRQDRPKQPRKPRPERKAEENAPAEQQGAQGKEEQPKNRSRRPNYYRRRKPKNGGANHSE